LGCQPKSLLYFGELVSRDQVSRGDLNYFEFQRLENCLY
jgi:hypothetical protein